MFRTSRPPFDLFAPPYDRLIPLEAAGDLVGDPELRPGLSLVWHLGRGKPTQDLQPALNRPGGVSLVVILPPAPRLRQNPDIFRVVEACRPHSILPFHEEAVPEELSALLRRPPSDLPAQVTDYLAWRGLRVDLDTRRLIRRAVELSEEVTTVSALSRRVYLSRRALGRRFLNAGLPVPSHLLHFSRVLRAAIRLQESAESIATVANALGYPDGFSMSNQMYRLTGARPSDARSRLGWEWLVEAWLRVEAREGGLRARLKGADGTEGASRGAQRQARRRGPGTPRRSRRTGLERGPGDGAAAEAG